jgi:hypothetical protein
MAIVVVAAAKARAEEKDGGGGSPALAAIVAGSCKSPVPTAPAGRHTAHGLGAA